MPRRNKTRWARNTDNEFDGNKLYKQPQNNNLKLKHIKALTDTQASIINSYYSGKNLVLHGYAGTGKTFLAMYLALKDVINPTTEYEKIIIVRSAVQSRDQGFLPGNLKEKQKVYELPYISICNDLFGRGDAYDILKHKRIIDFQTSSFIRGLTFENTVIIVDEFQSMVFHEIDTIITRCGQNTKFILCGDIRQNDLVNKKHETSGLSDAIRLIDNMPEFDKFEFLPEDIVRSGLVKSWILAKEKLEIY